MPKCKNQECNNGRTPGVIAVPKPKPQIGIASMRWGWVPCPVCHPNPKITFKPLRRTEDEIEARADLADRKATYVKDTPSTNLARVRPQQRDEEEDDDQPPVNGHTEPLRRSTSISPAPATSDLSDLIKALNAALAQQAILQAENAELRRQLAEATAPITFGSARPNQPA